MDSSSYSYALPGSSPLGVEQDFCLGAKSGFIPSYVGSAEDQISSFDFGDHLNLQQMGVDFDSLDAFNDVILQENQPLDLLGSIFHGSIPTNLDEYMFPDPENSFLFPTSDLVHDESSIIDIKDYLNPVKPYSDVDGFTPDQLMLDQSPPPLAEPSVKIDSKPILQSDPSLFTIRLKKFKYKKAAKKHLNKVNDEAPNHVQKCRQVPDARMTLKEAINMENAHVILDRLFEQDSDGDSDDGKLTPSAPSSPCLSPSPNFLLHTPEQPASPTSSEASEDPLPRLRDRGRYSVAERRNKKKEQNKMAALRYRNKKRQVDEDLHRTLMREEEKQKMLKKTLKGLKHEVKFTAKLLREAFIIKGLVSADAFKIAHSK